MYIRKETAVPYMDKMNPPAAHCSSGDQLTFQTKDCFGDYIRKDTVLVHTVPKEAHNLATGPVYVDGAEPGDVLKVEIQKIVLDEVGCQGLIPGDGPLGVHVKEEYSKVFSVKDGSVLFNDKLRILVSPMIGVIGTAPAGDPIDNVTPGEHGSNMDNNKIQEGSVLYLPVNVPGALLAMGDIHAVMGNGEASTCGLEISGEITVKVTVLKDLKVPTPFLAAKDEYITIASAKTLDEAVIAAAEKMHYFLGLTTELDEYERNMLLSLVGDLEICQVVNPLKTVRMAVPKMVFEAYNYKLP